MITDKVWGTTQLLTPNAPFTEIHRLKILPYSRCSMHMHQYKWNAFIVISGLLIIEQEFENDRITTIELHPGNFITIRPGHYHRFSTQELDTVAFEIYYPESLSDDILRRDVGGRCLPLLDNVA